MGEEGEAVAGIGAKAAAAEDLARWAFRENGPWVLRRDSIGWLDGLDRLRAAEQADVPRLLQPSWIPPLRRFGQAACGIGGALVLWWIGDRRRGGEVSRAGLSRRLREAFEHLGSAYIKLGQIVSSGRGLFPDELVDEFKRCRDQVPPEPFEAVRKVVESDLGRPLEDVFASFDRECLASASIAQVHAATLCSGETVVVKVQRPKVAQLVRRDIAAMAWIAPRLVGRIPVAALANPPALVELFAETILEELDFRLEAENMLDVAHVLRDAGQEAIVVPRPHPELVTRRVLVMERLEGFTYDDVAGMKAAGVDTEAVLRSMMIAFLEGAMIYGVFHGDLHGGNLVVMADGRVALFDYGITGRMSEDERTAFLRLMMTGAMNDVRGQLAAIRDLGALDADADLDELMTTLKLDQPVKDPTKMSGEEIATEVQQVLKVLLKQGARLPKPLMLYAKDMLFFDGAVAELAPDLNMFAEMARIYTYFVQRHGATIAARIGFDPAQTSLDLTGVKASLGLNEGVESITHRELQERRQIIQRKFEESGARLPRIDPTD
ncbi:MAG: AarF/ABC1/UbiB kinase family protein [Deltaproteobacteria bacterium]|nr:AarF/ABC1/UbiB kinase family protein [Deltaproteobacteria bacterium]MBW2696729.1 AarF/ABC1/UbiB kinase family protein [Deltaproteobacteria bacterium]